MRIAFERTGWSGAGLAAAMLLAVCAARAPGGEAPAGEKPGERLPIPVGSWVADAEKQLKETLKDEYLKKGAADRSALAKRLLKLAQESKKELLTYYIALREARDVAVSAGDAETALTAIDLLAETFEVDEAESKANALAGLARNAATPEAAEKAFHVGVTLLDQLGKGAQLDAAVKLLHPLDDLARRANNPEFVKTIQARAKETRARQAEWARVKPHFEKLAAEPEDAEAALAVAKYHVASEGDWDHALPLLAKCSVPALKEAAAKDLAKPEGAAAQADLGDRWWSVSERETGALKAAFQRRAAAWYNQALEGLSGPQKGQAEKRVQAAAGLTGSAGEWLKTAGLVFWVNPSLDPAGKPRDLVSNAQPTSRNPPSAVADAGVSVLKFGGGNDLVYPASDAVRASKTAGSAFVWIKIETGAERYPGVLFRGCAPGPAVGRGYTDFSLVLHENKLLVIFNWPECGDPPWAAGMEGRSAFYSKHPLAHGKWGMFGCTWDGKMVSIYLNGERDNAYKFAVSPLKRASPPSIFLGNDPAGLPEYFTGMIHSAMIFNRALTDPEVKQLYLMHAQGR